MIATIRATDHEDLPALSKFLVRAYKFEPSDFHFDPRLLKRKYLHPRAGWLGSRSYLFERSGKIVAHGGICPVSFRLPTGRIVSGRVIVDWAADSRMPALGVMMYRKLMQTPSTSFAIGGEPDTRKILPRIGFRHVGDASIYAAWLRPWLEFRTRPSTGRSLAIPSAPAARTETSSAQSHSSQFASLRQSALTNCTFPHDCESAFNPRFFLYDNHPGLAAGRTLGES
jgi:hypothetical protein